MSLIRSTSNPEALYVWGDGRAYSFSSNQHPLDRIPQIPQRAFNAFMRAYVHPKVNQHDDFAHCRVKIAEHYVLHKTNQIVRSQAEISRYMRLSGAPRGAFKWVLTYEGRHIVTMWQTTWFYIVAQNGNWSLT